MSETSPGTRWSRGEGALAVIVVGVAYLAAQLSLFSLDRAASWDEAIYLSQVAPGAPALPFAPSRARGITLLIAPLLRTGTSLAGVRAFLAIASAAALVAAFGLWVPVLGRGAAIATFMAASTWLALLYGSEVMPNLWLALLGVAAVALLARSRRTRDLLATSVLVGLMAVFRPPDAWALFAGLGACLIVRRGASLRTFLWLGGGLVVGSLPWLIETEARFGAGGVDAAGRLAHVTLAGLGERLAEHLALTDGPLKGPELHATIPVAGSLWWAALVSLVLVGVVRSRRSPTFDPILLATFAGSALAAEYLVLVSGLAPRFLLPAYALLSVPAAAGLVSLWHASPLGRVAAIAAFVLFVGLAAWQVATANRLEAAAGVARSGLRAVGLAVHEEAGGVPCLVASPDDFPEIAYAAGCRGVELTGSEDPIIGTLEQPGTRAFVVLRSPSPAVSTLSSGQPFPVRAADGRVWLVYALT